VAHQRNIEDLAKLGRAINTTMAGLGVSLEPLMLGMLVEEVGRLPDVIRELELATARRAVHQVLAMFESHLINTMLSNLSKLQTITLLHGRNFQKDAYPT
jgi:hypothetical protein